MILKSIRNLKLLIVFLSIFIVFSCEFNKKNVQENDSSKPNIVFLFTDDQTYSSIAALGNDEIITPTLDKMVKEGTTFTHAYNMGAWNGAVCAASRAMIISGRFVWRANEFRQNWIKKDSLDKTWGKLMEKAGYTTYMTGKWHVDAPAQSVFQNVVHVRPGMPKDSWDHNAMVAKFDSISKVKDGNYADIMPNGYNRPLSKKDTSWLPTDTSKGGFWEGGKHWSEVLKDDAIGFIDKAKESDQPFFMYLAFNAPHDPRQAPQEYQDLYITDSLSKPKSFAPFYEFKDAMLSSEKVRDEALAPMPRTEYAIKVHKHEYYASISHVDAQIGQILQALKSSGKMDNTYIFLTADHGLAMGKHGLLGKQNLFDHSLRPPMLVIGPDIPKDKRVDADVYLQDIMATALEIAGLEKPSYVEFNSFLDLAKGNSSQSHYDAIYGGYRDSQRMIRKDGYKLLVYPKIEKVLLFDLEKDPEEMNDISKIPEQKERVQTLFKDLIDLQHEMEDPLDMTSIYQSI